MNLLNQKYSKEVSDIIKSSAQYPSLTKAEDGTMYVCYQEYKDGHDCIVAGVLNQEKDTFSEVERISGEGEALKPVCVSSGNQIWYAWGECRNQVWGIYYRSYENGVYGEIHCAEEGEALFYPCLYAKDGIVYLLWNRQSSNAGEIVLSTIDEEGIHDVQVVSTSKETYRPSICITEDHTIYVAYDSFNGTTYDVIVRACKDQVWTEEKVVNTSKTAWATQPLLASLKDKALVCWYDFNHGSDFSYHSAVVFEKDGKANVEESCCFARGIDWYEDIAISSNAKGEVAFSYSWGKTKLHARHYDYENKWSDPVVFTYDENSFASNQRVLIDEDGTIHLAWQYGNQNGHKPIRNAKVVYTWLNKDEYDSYVDLEAEKVSDPFTRPIEANKTLDRIDDGEVKTWIKKNGYAGKFPVYGDIHGQSGMSDGVGEIDQYFNSAKVWGKLDFTALTDHDCYPDWLSQSEWEWIRTTSQLFNVENKMATLLAYEWTPNEYRYDFGHKNIYYKGFEGEIYRSGDEGGMTPDRLFESIKQYKAMAFPHHPAASWKLVSAATDWAFHDEEVQRMVEIFSRHAPFEYYGNYSKYTKNNMQIERCSVQDALEKGYHLGFTAGSDSHQMEHGVEGGITISFVDKLNNENIWDNLYDRFMYGTSGAGILVSFKCDGKEMGQIVEKPVHSSVDFTVSVLGTDKLKVEVLCNNKVIEEKVSDGRECDFTFTKEVNEQEDFYYVRVTQEDEHQAWSSPIWVKGNK